MAKTEPAPPPRLITSLWPPGVLIAVGIGMFAWSQAYAPVAARFPAMVSGLLIFLALLDLLGRTSRPVSGLVRAIGGAGFNRREMAHDPPLRAQWAMVFWIAGCFVAMAVLGILAAATLFCIAFVRFRGGHSWTVALTVGAVVLAFQFVIFEWLLDYELYRGLFLAKGGVSAW